LTYKEDYFIYLKSRDDTAFDNLIGKLIQIYHFDRQFGNLVELVFLHLPGYSIYHHNFYYGDYINQFKDDDYRLYMYLQILDVNLYIDDINRILHPSSPKFSLDLQKPRRRDRHPQIIYIT